MCLLSDSDSAPSLLADPRINLLTNGTLQINNVSHSDATLYTCSVANSNQSIDAELEVLSKRAMSYNQHTHSHTHSTHTRKHTVQMYGQCTATHIPMCRIGYKHYV